MLVVGSGSEASRLRQRLARHFLTVESARTLDESREVMRRCRFHVLMLVDPDEPWPALKAALDECEWPPADILLITGKARAETAVGALRGGVTEAILRPFTTAELVAAAKRICARGGSRQQPGIDRRAQSLAGNSAAIRELRAAIDDIAPAAASILIEGEAGTGRALVARLLHEQGQRRGPFVAVDCSATGAGQLAENLRETSDGGTLLLRDVHRLPLDLQAELLRSMGPAPARRVVASTDAALGELATRGRFRSDLYHRLGVLRIGLPPLRERREDIPLLAEHFAARLAAEAGLSQVDLQPAEIEALVQHDWPGNVAELRRTVEQTLLRGQLPADALVGTVERAAGTPDYPLDWTLEQVKRHHMICVLEACDGNKSAAARRLDISRKTLDRKLGSAGHD
jgi:DNA-binding NtrC family response regulator